MYNFIVGIGVLGVIGAVGYALYDTAAPSHIAARVAEQRTADKQCRQLYHVATAPDGTQLWGVKESCGGRVVYFSSKGTNTSHDEPNGKQHVEVDDTVSASQ